MTSPTAPATRRECAAAFTVAALTAADRRGAEALVLGYLLGVTRNLAAEQAAEYLAGVRQGLDAVESAAERRRAALRALGCGEFAVAQP